VAEKKPGDHAGGDRSIATNRKARHAYEIIETVEAGLALIGSEIKSIRAGGVSLQEAFVAIDAGEAWLQGAHIAPYTHAGYAGHEPRRPRKLLLHRREIIALAFQTRAKGMTLIPLRLYLKNGRAKLEIGLARGKRQYDKRQAIRERETKRQVAREVSRRR